MHLTAQLFVGLFIELAILDIHGKLTSNDLEKVHLILTKIAWFLGLDRNDSLQLDHREENNGDSKQAAVRLASSAFMAFRRALSVSDSSAPARMNSSR